MAGSFVPTMVRLCVQILAEEAAEEDEEMIGPPPPELAEELDAAGADERSEEVVRILRCVTAACLCVIVTNTINRNARPLAANSMMSAWNSALHLSQSSGPCNFSCLHTRRHPLCHLTG